MPPDPIPFFARTLRGTEWLAAAEIGHRCGGAITDVKHREIRFQLDRLQTGILELGSVDDLFLTCRILNEVDHKRSALAALSKDIAGIDFAKTISQLTLLREISELPSFDVIASFLGRRNYNRFEIEDSVAAVIRRQTGWNYSPQREGKKDELDLSFRIHLSGNEGIIGARLSSAPLHRRSYKLESRAGTLHPPLAFGLAMLAGLKANHNLLDPFCGVGTILIEALKLEPGLSATGIDIDIESISKAVVVAANAKKDIRFLTGDAGRLPFDKGRIDRIISNLPWGRAVDFRGDARSCFEEFERVTADDARIVLLIDGFEEQAQLDQRGFNILLRTPVSLFGSWPEILILARESQGPGLFIDDSSGLGLTLAKYWKLWPSLFDKTQKPS